jgi:hypothetical protein
VRGVGVCGVGSSLVASLLGADDVGSLPVGSVGETLVDVDGSVEVPDETGGVVVGVAVVDGATLVGVGATLVGETGVFAGGVTDVVIVAGDVGFGVTEVVEVESVEVTGPGVPVLSVVEQPSKKVPTKNPYRDVCMMKSESSSPLSTSARTISLLQTRAQCARDLRVHSLARTVRNWPK